MNRGIVGFILALVIVLVVAIVFIAPNTRNDNKGESDPLSGLEDSIFDDDSEESEEAEDKKEDSADGQQTEQAPAGGQQTEQTPTGGQSAEQNKTPDVDDEEQKEDVVIQEMNYETFSAMTPKKQREYMESFASIDAFFDWYNAEKEKYEKEHPSIEVENGAVDLDKVAGDN